VANWNDRSVIDQENKAKKQVYIIKNEINKMGQKKPVEQDVEQQDKAFTPELITFIEKAVADYDQKIFED